MVDVLGKEPTPAAWTARQFAPDKRRELLTQNIASAKASPHKRGDGAFAADQAKTRLRPAADSGLLNLKTRRYRIGINGGRI